MSVEILPFDAVSEDQVRAGMQAGFSDYALPLRLNPQQFAFMMRQRGLDRAASFVAVADGAVQSVWLTAVDGARGYLIASATAPAFRGQGVARRLAERCLDHLKARQVTTFQTEVLQQNVTALALYRSLGMEPRRGLASFELEVPREAAPDGIATVAWSDIAGEVAALRDWAPSWQNDDAALARVADALRCVAIREGAALAGYAAFIPSTGTLAQIAVRPDRRRRGIGKSLLRALNASSPLRLLNAQEDDAGFAAFLLAAGGRPIIGQWELHVTLTS